jgi:cobalamin biosynthesis Mg chelatase CobN
MTKTNGVRQSAALKGCSSSSSLSVYLARNSQIVGLLVFVVVAVAIYRAFPEEAES